MQRNQGNRVPLEKIDDYSWRIPMEAKPGMRVPGMVFADETLLQKMKTDRTLTQCMNVAHLPGILKYSITLPDGHEGYGFPIGGVAVTDFEDGALSPGGVGYDINCGVRLLTTNLNENQIKPKLGDLTDRIFRSVPSGLGSRRKDFRVSDRELDMLVREGVPRIVEQGMGRVEDADHCEEQGCMKTANPEKVSQTAKKRGRSQVGTLGSGNHFLEIQRVDRIVDVKAAKAFGIDRVGQVTVMIHCGSRGFGHQVCSDYLRVMEGAVRRYGISLPDRELACAPGNTREAEDYFQAMSCAINYAFINRQVITHSVRESFRQVFNQPSEEFGLDLVYDVAHNIAKIEEHVVSGSRRKVWIHRKGATRAFPRGHPDVPVDYRDYGQPVIIPGSMGSNSWVLVGTEKAMEVSFGSTAHGAGRMMSRSAARRRFRGNEIRKTLGRRGIIVRAASPIVLAEEADSAYKDVNKVVEVSDRLGIAARVAKLSPMAVIKG